MYGNAGCGEIQCRYGDECNAWKFPRFRKGKGRILKPDREEILRAPNKTVILRPEAEESQSEILRYAQDDGVLLGALSIH